MLGCLGNIESLRVQAGPGGLPQPVVTVQESTTGLIGLVINALTAAGSFSAAAAALWIATSDRHDRKQER